MAPQRRATIAQKFLSLLADFVAVGTFIVSAVLFSFSAVSTWPQTARVALFAAGLVALAAASGLAASWIANRNREPLGYKWISVDQTYEFDEENPRIQRMVALITIEATRDNVFLFVDRTHWTGVHPPKLSIQSHGHSLLESPHTFEGWRTYVVPFKNPLMKGQQAVIKLVVAFTDVSLDSSHWVSKTPTERIHKSLILRLDLGKNSPDKDKYEATVMKPGVGQNAVLRVLTPDRDERTGLTSVTVNRPRLGVRYQLKVEYEFSAEAVPDLQAQDRPWRRS